MKTERGSVGDMKLDHIIPLELGGANNEKNLKHVKDFFICLTSIFDVNKV